MEKLRIKSFILFCVALSIKYQLKTNQNMIFLWKM